MRIANVICIEDNSIVSIESFPIHEEQLSDEVVEKAEEDFEKKAIEIGADPDDIEDLIVDGFYECPATNRSVSLAWIYID